MARLPELHIKIYCRRLSDVNAMRPRLVLQSGMAEAFHTIRNSVRTFSLTGWAFAASIGVVALCLLDIAVQLFRH
jgi:hypothetical protein